MLDADNTITSIKGFRGAGRLDKIPFSVISSCSCFIVLFLAITISPVYC